MIFVNYMYFCKLSKLFLVENELVFKILVCEDVYFVYYYFCIEVYVYILKGFERDEKNLY